MRPVRYAKPVACILAAFALACPWAPIGASEEDALRVLVITDSDQRAGPFRTISAAFSSELLQRESRPIAMRYVDLNVPRQTTVTDEIVNRLLIERVFAPDPPDLVVAFGPPAVSFWQQNLVEAFSDVPLLACGAEVGGMDPAFIATQRALVIRFSFDEQIADIRNLLPETRHVFMVFGATAHERRLAGVARRQARVTFDDISVELSSDMPFDRIVDRVAQLQEGSVVYYVTADADVTNEPVSEKEGLAQIRAASAVPVFGPFDNQLGRGIVGGRLIELEAVGQALAEQAYGILNGHDVPLGARFKDLSASIYDWRELRAWNIPLDRLPEAGEILFTPPGPWELYRSWIVAVVLLIAAQAWVIVLWSIQRRRSRRNKARSLDLGQRLITAHEDERRVIARELHDDLSQRLARLSIDASQVASDVTSEKNTHLMDGMRQELQQLGKDVHDLSYRLHPAVLQDLGLANALRAECDRLRRGYDVRILDRIEDIAADLPMATQLNLYRIGQQALHNAVKHAAADRIEVELLCDNGSVSLAVSDNGRGFAPDEAGPDSSLGLLNMRERARLIGSALEIHSAPARGTTIRVSVSERRKAK